MPPEDYVLQEFAKAIRDALVRGVPVQWWLAPADQGSEHKRVLQDKNH